MVVPSPPAEPQEAVQEEEQHDDRSPDDRGAGFHATAIPDTG